VTRPIVFVGPSISRADCESLIDADFRPPAARGHVHRAALERPSSILLIDGTFESTPAVLHREILGAIAAGITVVGAASLGALRAAELDKFGMIGHGSIYMEFRDGTLNGDDEVALLHGPAELNYLPLSEPLVTMRATLAAAQKAGLLQEYQREQIVRSLKQLCFRDRSFDAIARLSFEDAGTDRASLVLWCYANRVDKKYEDARSVLLRAAAGEFCAPVPLRFIRTTVWAEAIEDWDIYLEG
jgi:hypothetical protein